MKTLASSNGIARAALACLLLASRIHAQAGFQQISQPDAAYLASTTKLSITVPDNQPVQSLSDGILQMSFLDNPAPPVATTVYAQTWPWSSPPDSESSTPRCLFYPYTDDNVGSLVIGFSKPLQTFGAEIEFQDPGLTNDVVVRLYKGSLIVGEVTRTLGGPSSARLFAARSDTAFFDWVQINCPNSAPGYAVAQLRYALAPPPPPQHGPGRALEFNGNYPAYVWVPPINLSGGSALTLEIWLQPRPLDPGNREVMQQLGQTSPEFLLGFRGGTNLAFGVRTEFGFQELRVPINAAEYSGGDWYQLAAVYDGATEKLYRNGQLIGATNATGRLVFTQTASMIGAAGRFRDFELVYVDTFLGRLDEARQWSVARTTAEINQTLHRTLAGNEPGLEGYWRFDDNLTLDSSGHGRTAVLLPSPNWVVPVASGALLGQPIAQTANATDATTNSARLNGNVALFDWGATAWFEWSVANTTNRTTNQNFGDVLGTNAVTQLVTNLSAGSSFAYRCGASNSAGMSFGNWVQSITPGPPVVATLPPTGLAATSVVLQGAVNPFGIATAAWFDWGSNTNYGNRSAARNVGSGFTTVALNETLTNLLAGQQYHYRLAVSNALGQFFGTNQSFRVPIFGSVFAPWGSLTDGAVAWGDYDGDGDLDLAFTGTIGTNGNSGVFRNDGATFNPVWTAWYYGQVTDATFPHVTSGPVIWCDLNNDGALDLLLSGDREYFYYEPNNQPATVWLNTGGRFTPVTNLTTVGRSAAAVGDYDNDGYLDVLLTGLHRGDNTLTNLLYHNNGNGTFTDVHAGLPAVFDGAAAWGDCNNDGQLDLLLAGDTGSGLIARVYHNNHGAFTDIGAGLLGVASGSAAWGDFDGDGWLDILLAGSTNGTASGAVCRIYRNNHDGTFADTSVSLPGVYKGTAVWGDYDNDGQLDILITGTAPARIYRNDQGVFTDIGAGLPSGSSGAAAWGDYDGDDRLDLALFGSSYPGGWGGTLNVFRNYLPGTNTPPNPPTAPGGLLASVLNNAATLRWNAASDAHTPMPGLTYNVRVGTTPGGGQIVAGQSDSVTGQRRLPQRGNAGHRLFATLTNLPVGLYYWSVQTVNHSFVGSPWAPEQTLTTLPRVLGVSVQTAPAAPGALLRFSGLAGSGYVMEASTNLVNWLALTNLVAGPDGLFEYLDTSATNFPTRFYRLRVP